MIRALQEFIDTSLGDALAGADDEAAARARVLELFHSVARDVPAYAAFLAERNIDPESVRAFADFERPRTRR